MIKDLAASPDGPVTVSGWVETVRDQKKVQFVVLRDESGAVQLVHPRAVAEDGIVVADELADHDLRPRPGQLPHRHRRAQARRARQARRRRDQARRPSTVASRPPSPRPRSRTTAASTSAWTGASSTCASRRTTSSSASRPRSSTPGAPTGSTTTSSRLHTPKLMASASESKAELFEVGYFDGKAYLAQSPQFFKQMAQPAGFGKIFEIGPAFRADPSFTSRHATEFTSVDAEISWIDTHEDVMTLHEELLVAGFQAVKDKHGERDRGAVRRRGDRSLDAVPAHPAGRGEAHRRRARLRGSAPRRRHGPGGRAPDRRLRQGDLRPRVRVPHRLRLEHPAVLPHAPRG